MLHAPCVRCGQLVSPRRAEAVGGGYRCDLCSAIAVVQASRARRMTRWIIAMSVAAVVALGVVYGVATGPHVSAQCAGVASPKSI